jgi:hypothetical protein
VSYQGASSSSNTKVVSLSEQIRIGGLSPKPTAGLPNNQISLEKRNLNSSVSNDLSSVKISVESSHEMSSSSYSPRLEVSSDGFSPNSKFLPNQYVPFQEKCIVIREVDDNAEDESSIVPELPSRTLSFQNSQDYIEVVEEGEDDEEEDDVFEFLHWKQGHLQQVNWNRVPKLLDKQRARYETDMFAALCPADQTEINRLMSVPVLLENGEERFYTFEEAALYCFNWQRGLKLPLPGGLSLSSKELGAQSNPSSKNTSPESSWRETRSDAVNSNRNVSSQQSLCSKSDSSFGQNSRERAVSNRDFNRNQSTISELSIEQELHFYDNAEVIRLASMERNGSSPRVFHAQSSAELAASSYYFNAYEQFFSQLRGFQDSENPQYGMTEEEVMRWTLLLSEQEDVYGKNMFDILDGYRDHWAVQRKVREDALSFAEAVLKVFQEKFGLAEPPQPPIAHVTFVPGINSSGNTTSSHSSVPVPPPVATRSNSATDGNNFHSTMSSQSAVVSSGSDVYSETVNTYNSNNANSNSGSFYRLMNDSSAGGMQSRQRPMYPSTNNTNLLEANNEMMLRTQSTANSSMDPMMLSMMMPMYSTPSSTIEANAAVLQQQQLQLQQLQQQLQQTNLLLQQAQQQHQHQQQQQLQQQLLQQQALLASITMHNQSQRSVSPVPQVSALPVVNMNGVPTMNQSMYGMSGVVATPSQSMPTPGMVSNYGAMQGMPMMSNSGFTTPAASLSHSMSHSDSFSRSSHSNNSGAYSIPSQYPQPVPLHLPQQLIPTVAHLDSPTMRHILRQQQQHQDQQQQSHVQPLPQPQAHTYSRHHRSHSDSVGNWSEENPAPALGNSSQSRGHRRKTSSSSHELMTIAEDHHAQPQQVGSRKKSIHHIRRHSDVPQVTAETMSNASGVTSRRGSMSSLGSDGNLSANGSSGGSQFGNTKQQRLVSNHGHAR